LVTSRVIACLFLASAPALTLLNACARPIVDVAKLEAIRKEARSLARSHPLADQGAVDIPKSQWPPAIASLDPKNVTVDHQRVDILIQQGFDGCYGYEIPRDGVSLAMQAQCYSQPGKGIFWHNPC